MKTISRRKAERAFTLIELVIVIAAVLVLAAMLLPGSPRNSKQRAIAVNCASNLRQVGMGFWMWADDHHGALPWQITSANGGTMSPTGGVSSYFSAVSNFFPAPRLFLCPADRARQFATNFAGLSDQNISYFINLDAVRIGAANAPRSIVAGDRNLQISGKPVKPGLLVVAPGTDLAWTPEFHRLGRRLGGNLVFTDGQAGRTSDLQLPDAVHSQGATNRFLFP